MGSRETSEPLDVIVAGGGAAGIFAATAAGEHGMRTVLLERMKKPGIKVLASGGSRCNVTSVLPVHELARHFGRDGGRFLGHALKELPPRAVVELLEREGVPTYEEKWDKVFPQSNRATDVLAAFLRRMERAGVELRCDARLRGVEREADGSFVVRLEDDTLRARRVILATGGKSYPKTGSTGDGYDVALAFGHTLVPLLTDAAWVRESTGIAFQDVAVELVDAAGKRLATRRRPLLCTHFGVSGAAAMDVSREATLRDATTLRVDFAPEVSAHDSMRELEAAIAREPNRLAVNVLPEHLGWPEKFAERLLLTRGVDVRRRAAELSRAHKTAIVELAKAAPIPIRGSRGFDFAEVTAGGVTLDEIDPRTMESRRVPGLYFCGEVLDVDGPIGGFNFQAAFSTGHVAGSAAAR
jgi:predicted Rossmann fold flavoprotein